MLKGVKGMGGKYIVDRYEYILGYTGIYFMVISADHRRII